MQSSVGRWELGSWIAIAGTTCIEDSLRAKPIMPPQEDEALPDVGPGAGRGDCESSALIATEVTNNNSQSQQDAVLPEVGAVASTENNAEEDGDTTFITAESQTHADDLATTCSGASPPSPGSNFRRGGDAEAEEVCEQNRHGMSAGGAGALTDADARSSLSTFSGPDKKYTDEEALNVQIALAACAHDEQGNSNTCAGSDASFTDSAAATAGARGDASTISGARGDGSTTTTPATLASASASGEVSSSLSGTTLTSTWTAGVLSSIPDEDDMGGDGNGNDSTREDATDFTNRTATAIDQSIHDTPGAFYVTPINVAVDSNSSADGQEDATGTRTVGSSSSNINSNNHGNNDVQAGQEQAPTSANSFSDVSVGLAQAWVVEEEDAHWRPSTVTATPIKERRWFNTVSGGILLTLFFVGCVAAVAVAITTKKKKSQSASPSRPFDLEAPSSMPRDVSKILKIKYNKFTKDKPFVMTFSADLTVHASTLVDDYYGQLQVVRYSANLSSWEVLAKYDGDEARAEDQKIGQFDNSFGDLFGAWADMSYDGRILAVGLPRDDPLNVPNAGSVRVMKLETPLEHNGDSLDLKGHGNYIAGTDPFGWTGMSFSLSSDGSMIAVASPLASNFRGNVIVYKFGSNDTVANGGEWIQIGQTIIGDETEAAVGFVKLSEDGSMLTVCPSMHDEKSGQVKIYSWDTSTNLWAQMGSAIEGNGKDRLGMFPQFSRDGLTVAVTEYGVDELMRPLNSYKCHVYRWQGQEHLNSDWVRIDDDLVFPYGYIGMDLSPDGKRVLLCSPNKMRCILNSLHSGKWHEAQEFLVDEHGFLPLLFERNGDGIKIAGIVAPMRKSDGYTIGFYNIN